MIHNTYKCILNTSVAKNFNNDILSISNMMSSILTFCEFVPLCMHFVKKRRGFGDVCKNCVRQIKIYLKGSTSCKIKTNATKIERKYNFLQKIYAKIFKGKYNFWH